MYLKCLKLYFNACNRKVQKYIIKNNVAYRVCYDESITSKGQLFWHFPELQNCGHGNHGNLDFI